MSLHPQPHLNGVQKKNLFGNFFEQVMRMKIGALATLIMLIGGIGGYAIKTVNWVNDTNDNGKVLKTVVDKAVAHEDKDNAKWEQLSTVLNKLDVTLTKMNGRIDVVDAKIDDVKHNGQGYYNEQTKQVIRKNRE